MLSIKEQEITDNDNVKHEETCSSSECQQHSAKQGQNLNSFFLPDA